MRLLNFESKRDKLLGNIYAKQIDGKDFCFHYYLLDQLFGPFVRVYRGLSPDPEHLEIDCLGLGIIPAIRRGGWKKIGFLDPGNPKLGPALFFEPPYPNEWFLIEHGRRKSLGFPLPSHYANLEVLGTSNYLVLEERLTTGFNKYSATMWIEHKQKFER